MATTLFIGVPGSGKTLAMQDTVTMLADEWPCFIMDNAFEWLEKDLSGEENVRWRGRQPRIVRVPRMAIDEAYEFVMSDANAALGAFVFERFDGWKPQEVATLTGMVGDAYYVDDEIDIYATYKQWNESALKEYLHRGRHTPDKEGFPREVHILGAMRRPQNVHTDLTSLCNEAYVFRCQGSKTIDRLKTDGFIETKEDEKTVTSMPDLHFFRWRNNGTIVRGHLVPLPKQKRVNPYKEEMNALRLVVEVE